MARMLTPGDLVNKAAITSGSFTGGIGLTTQEADQFIDYVVDESFLKNNARVERMTSATKNIDFIGLGSRVLKPAKAAVDPGETVNMATSRIQLVAKEMIAIARISDDSLEDGLEGDAFVDHLMKMVAKQAGNELEGAYSYGRAVTDPVNNALVVEQLFDGWFTRARAGGHVVDAKAGFADQYIGNEKLSRLVKGLPTKFRRNRPSLRFVMADDLYQDYNDVVGARFTSLGDAAHQGLLQLRYGNILLETMSSCPTDLPVRLAAGMNASTLTGAHAAGVNVINVAAAAGAAPNDILLVDGGTGWQEIAVVQSVNANAITLKAPLIYAHAAGGAVWNVEENGTEVLLTDYRNLIVGIHRDVRVETERHARLRATDFVVTLRTDVQMENPDACSILTSAIVR